MANKIPRKHAATFPSRAIVSVQPRIQWTDPEKQASGQKITSSHVVAESSRNAPLKLPDASLPVVSDNTGPSGAVQTAENVGADLAVPSHRRLEPTEIISETFSLGSFHLRYSELVEDGMPQDTLGRPPREVICFIIRISELEPYRTCISLEICAFYKAGELVKSRSLALARFTAHNIDYEVDDDYPAVVCMNFTQEMTHQPEWHQSFPHMTADMWQCLRDNMADEKNRLAYSLLTFNTRIDRDHGIDAEALFVDRDPETPNSLELQTLCDRLTRHATIQCIVESSQILIDQVQCFNEVLKQRRDYNPMCSWMRRPISGVIGPFNRETIIPAESRPHISVSRQISFRSMNEYVLTHGCGLITEREYAEKVAGSFIADAIFIPLKIENDRSGHYLAIVFAPEEKEEVYDQNEAHRTVPLPRFNIDDTIYIVLDAGDDITLCGTVIESPAFTPRSSITARIFYNPRQNEDGNSAPFSRILASEFLPGKGNGHITLDDLKISPPNCRRLLRTLRYDSVAVRSSDLGEDHYQQQINVLRLWHLRQGEEMVGQYFKRLLLNNNPARLLKYNAYDCLDQTHLNDVLRYMISNPIKTLNAEQVKFIASMTHAPVGVSILVGPPGTGKTLVGETIVLPMIMLSLDKSHTRQPVQSAKDLSVTATRGLPSNLTLPLPAVDRRCQVLVMSAANVNVNTLAKVFTSEDGYLHTTLRHFNQDRKLLVVRLHSWNTEKDVFFRALDKLVIQPELFGEDVMATLQELDKTMSALTVAGVFKDSFVRKFSFTADHRFQELKTSAAYHMLGHLGILPAYPFADETVHRKYAKAREFWDMMRKSRQEYQAMQKGSEIERIRAESMRLKTEEEQESSKLFSALLTDILAKADIVLGTVAAMAASRYHEPLHPQLVVVEEATRLNEPEILAALVPLACHKPSIVMIGDPKQFSPRVETTEENNAFAEQLSVSLMERLILGGFPHVQQTIQYRMHKAICNLIAPEYPCGLRTDASVAKRPLGTKIRNHLKTHYPMEPMDMTGDRMFNAQPSTVRSVMVLAHKGEDAIDRNKSKYNETSLRVVVKAVEDAVNAGIRSESIAVIVFYRSQLSLYRKAFRGRSIADVNLLVIATADSVQGEEYDLVFLDVVVSRGIGFLKNNQRALVALSRAREGLVIVINLEIEDRCAEFKHTLIGRAIMAIQGRANVYRVSDA